MQPRGTILVFAGNMTKILLVDDHALFREGTAGDQQVS